MSQIIENQIPHASKDGGWQEHVASWFQTGGEPRALSSLAPDRKELHSGCAVAICTYKRADSLTRLLDSLPSQDRKADELIIVDASPDDETERAVRARIDLADLAGSVLYFRVQGLLKGLTRQRNFALRWVTCDLVAFFDDDVILEPVCLQEMEKQHREHADTVVGVGGYDLNQPRSPRLLWRLRVLLGIVPHLRPGCYCRSGMSTSWGLLQPTDETVEGDWLGGYSMMWRTDVAREVGFSERFFGYSQGEDLFFSLLMRRRGKLLVAGKAHLRHLHNPSGRPDHFKLGYMAIYNRYYIHRHGLENRTWRDSAWFTYAWTLDSLFLLRYLFAPGQWRATVQHLSGRLRATYDIARGH
jgi:GT2 family glycosyltransferase